MSHALSLHTVHTQNSRDETQNKNEHNLKENHLQSFRKLYVSQTAFIHNLHGYQIIDQELFLVAQICDIKTAKLSSQSISMNHLLTYSQATKNAAPVLIDLIIFHSLPQLAQQYPLHTLSKQYSASMNIHNDKQQIEYTELTMPSFFADEIFEHDHSIQCLPHKHTQSPQIRCQIPTLTPSYPDINTYDFTTTDYQQHLDILNTSQNSSVTVTIHRDTLIDITLANIQRDQSHILPIYNQHNTF